MTEAPTKPGVSIPPRREFKAADGGYDGPVTIGVNDYPWAGSSCCGMQPCGCAGADPYGYALRQCASFGAWRIRNDLGLPGFTPRYGGQWFGSAFSWLQAAQAAHVPVYTSPRPHTIMCISGYPWPYHTATTGHIAFVLDAGSGANGATIVVEDYNWQGTGPCNGWCEYHHHTMVDQPGMWYLDFAAVGSGVPAPSPQPPSPPPAPSPPPQEPFQQTVGAPSTADVVGAGLIVGALAAGLVWAHRSGHAASLEQRLHLDTSAPVYGRVHGQESRR